MSLQPRSGKDRLYSSYCNVLGGNVKVVAILSHCVCLWFDISIWFVLSNFNKNVQQICHKYVSIFIYVAANIYLLYFHISLLFAFLIWFRFFSRLASVA